MNRKKIFTEIVSEFEKKYSFLGKQFGEEFLLSVASWNIQHYSLPDFRIRRHLLLLWEPGFVKSSLLLKAYRLLGTENCIPMSDVTNAALRGTVNGGKFVTPYVLVRPFSIATEFGQIMVSDQEIVQKLLNVLEEGIVNVALAKISTLSEEAKDKCVKEHSIEFVDSNKFTYTTDWVLMAATYNEKFMSDHAFKSRFIVLKPTEPLGSKLTKHIIQSKPFVLGDDVVEGFRKELKSEEQVDCMLKLPDEVFELNPFMSVRDANTIISKALCKKWWGFDTSKEEMIAEAVKSTPNHGREEIKEALGLE